MADIGFDYHMRLHHAQTRKTLRRKINQFDYHMRLHHAQTSNSSIRRHHNAVFSYRNHDAISFLFYHRIIQITTFV